MHQSGIGRGQQLSDALHAWLKTHVDAHLVKQVLDFPDTISTIEFQLLVQIKSVYPCMKDVKIDQIKEMIAAMNAVLNYLPSRVHDTMDFVEDMSDGEDSQDSATAQSIASDSGDLYKMDVVAAMSDGEDSQDFAAVLTRNVVQSTEVVDTLMQDAEALNEGETSQDSAVIGYHAFQVR